MALTRKKVTVRGKNGKTFQRSVMVRAGDAIKRTAGKVGSFLNKHKGKIAVGAALAGGAALALNKHKLMGAARGIGLAHNAIKHSGEKVSLRDRLGVMAKGARAGAASNADMDKGLRHHANAAASSLRNKAGNAAFRAAGAIEGAAKRIGGAIRRRGAGAPPPRSR